MFEVMLFNGNTAIQIVYAAPTASELNIERYRWTNVVLEDSFPPLNRQGTPVAVPYFDPPLGGWGYEEFKSDNSKFYWEDLNCADCDPEFKVDQFWNANYSQFRFVDQPNQTGMKPGEQILFRTCLNDVVENKVVGCWEWLLNHQKRLKLQGKVENSLGM